MKAKTFILTLTILLTISTVLGAPLELKAQNETDNPVEANPSIEVYTDKWGIITEAGQAPMIDGKLDDSIWQEVRNLDNFVTAYYNEPAVSDTSVKMAFDEQSLYIGITQVDQDDALANFDIMLRPDNSSEEYFYTSIAISDFGVPVLTNDWGPGKQELEGYIAEVSKQDETVTAEIEVPFSSLGVDGVNPGEEWGMNVLAQSKLGTHPLSTWIPIRTSTYMHVLVDTITVQAQVSDEGRMGSIFFEELPEGLVSDVAVPLEPEKLLFEYVDYTQKELSFKQEDIHPQDTTVALKWKSPSGSWTAIDQVQQQKEDDRFKLSFAHPHPTEKGTYQLLVAVAPNDGEQAKFIILTFDRLNLIKGGNRLPINDSDTGEKTPVTWDPPSEEVEKLLELIPEKQGFRFTGLPEHPELKPDGNQIFQWSPDDPWTLTSKFSDLTYPNEQYAEDQVFSVKNRNEEVVEYPYYEDEDGNRYFLSAHLWYKQREYVLRQLPSIADKDPLGAARLLYRFAQVYEGYIPTNDYYWNNYFVDPATGPPYPYWGGMWSRWQLAELVNVTPMAKAYEKINETDAFEVLSEEVDEDVDAKIVDEMFKPSIEAIRSFPTEHHNSNNWIGLTDVGRAINFPDYVHEAIERTDYFGSSRYLFDGFYKNTTISYHNQQTTGINLAMDNLKGWSDPEGYISPRSGIRLDNFDMRKQFPALGKAAEIPSLLVYPNGKYYPTDDTWANEQDENPNLDAGSFLLPASGIARLAQGDGPEAAQVYLSATPKYGHHHLDPLNLTFFAKGQELLPDIGYTHTLYRQWTKSTLGHNTVVVDSDDMQVSGDAEHGGNIEIFAPVGDRLQVTRAHQETAYPQTENYSREPWFIDFPGGKDGEGYVLDLFRVSGGERHEYTLQGDANHDATFETDIPLNDYGPYLLPEGVEVTEPEIETDKGSAEGHYYGYIYVRDVKKADIEDGQYELTLMTDDDGQEKAKLKITGLVEPGQNELFLGESPSLRATRLHGTSMDNNIEAEKYTMPKMVLRREGNDLTSNFITALEPYADEDTPRIENIERLEPDQAIDGDIAVKVTHGETTDIILSSLDPGQPLVVGDMTLQGKMGMIRLKGEEVQEMNLVGGTMLKKGDVEITDEGPVTGIVTDVFRQAAGDGKDAFITDTPVSADMEGNTFVITHSDGKTHGYEIKKITTESGQSVIETEDMDPGFTINDNGTSALKFFPFTEWTGDTTFRIENTVQFVTDQEFSAAALKQLVERLESEGEFKSDDPAHALKLHLTAVRRFEKQEAIAKVVKHMNGFKLLLEHQKNNELLSERAYNLLKTEADRLMVSSK